MRIVPVPAASRVPNAACFVPDPAGRAEGAQEITDMLEPLIAAIMRYTDSCGGESPYATAIDGLVLMRSDRERPSPHHLFKPSLCVAVQGAKLSLFGDKRFVYRAGQALVVTMAMATWGRVIQASPDRPYLGAVIELDLLILRDVFETMQTPPEPGAGRRSAVSVSDFDGPLADCLLRSIRLLETPRAIPTVYPLIQREAAYWLLSGPHGGDVAGLALGSRSAVGVVSAIHALRERYTRPLRIAELAELAHMSSSAFHRQFKEATSMTPLQYQKQLRLLEARRLMVSEAASVEIAAYRVGYESASQFSREYARMFGAPPGRDADRVRSLSRPAVAGL